MKLTVGKGFCILIIIIACIGFLGIWNMRLINKNSERMYNEYTVAIKNLADVGFSANAIRLHIMDMLNTDDIGRMEEYQRKITDRRKTVDAAIEAYAASASTEEEKKALEVFKNHWTSYISAAQGSIDAATAALQAEDTGTMEDKARTGAVEDAGPKCTSLLDLVNEMIQISSGIKRVEPVTYLSNMKDTLTKIRAEVLGLVGNMDLDKRHTIMSGIKVMVNAVREDLKNFEAVNLSDEEKKALKVFNKKLNEYLSITRGIVVKADKDGIPVRDSLIAGGENQKKSNKGFYAKHEHAMSSLGALIETSNAVVRIPWIVYLNNIKLAVINMRMNMLNMLNANNLATKEGCLEENRNFVDSIHESLQLFEGIGLTEKEKEQFSMVRKGWDAYAASVQTVVNDGYSAAKIREGGKDRWSLTRAAKKNESEVAGPKFPPAIAAATTMLEVCDAVAKGLYTDSANKFKSAFLVLSVLVLLGISGGIYVGFFTSTRIARLFRSLIDDLTRGAHQIVSASSQICKSTQTVSQGTNEQAASLEETASSIEEISSTVKQNADNASEASKLSKSCNTMVEHGNAIVMEMDKAMNDISQSSGKIANIIKMIDDIAFQTNLLALNAAVEAARAGEYGREFSVVAEEVRSLAQRSSAAANDIKALITDSVNKAEVGTRLVKNTGEVFSQVVAQVRKVTDLINEIATASGEQTKGIEQINEAIQQMNNVVQENAANSNETTAASEILLSQAQELNVLIAKIVKEVHADETSKQNQESQPLEKQGRNSSVPIMSSYIPRQKRIPHKKDEKNLTQSVTTPEPLIPMTDSAGL